MSIIPKYVSPAKDNAANRTKGRSASKHSIHNGGRHFPDRDHAFKLTERYAVQGKIEGVKSTITALEDAYIEKNDTEGGIEFLKKTLNTDAWDVIAESDSRIAFGVSAESEPESKTDPLILEAVNSGAAAVEVDGINIPPFSTYKGSK